MRIKQLHFSFLICLLAKICLNLGAEIKETHAIIGEWVTTERLISEEESDWETEKAALLDLKQALGAELGELNAKLKETEEEAVGAAKQRQDLTARKDAAQQATRSLHHGLDRAVAKLERAFSCSPLRWLIVLPLPQKTGTGKRDAHATSASTGGRTGISLPGNPELPPVGDFGKAGIHTR